VLLEDVMWITIRIGFFCDWSSMKNLVSDKIQGLVVHYLLVIDDMDMQQVISLQNHFLNER
jgi:hypothetical protein